MPPHDIESVRCVRQRMTYYGQEHCQAFHQVNFVKIRLVLNVL